ncbi:hypothetical protein [Streptomyces sp. NBC_00019]|uniref:hypothetical protein n=1 Tax=Streptomyces sp. NBC_00019 TaxID=2975623 RepID=UPI00324C5AC4
MLPARAGFWSGGRLTWIGHPTESPENESAWLPGLVEVVSQGSRLFDYEVKPRWYASRGSVDYVILDPLKGHAVTMTEAATPSRTAPI